MSESVCNSVGNQIAKQSLHEAWGKSPFLAVHGQGYICIIKFHIDLEGNQLMKLFHSLRLDELSAFTL